MPRRLSMLFVFEFAHLVPVVTLNVVGLFLANPQIIFESARSNWFKNRNSKNRKTQKTENSNPHRFGLHRPSSKGIRLQLQVIKAIINHRRRRQRERRSGWGGRRRG